MYGQLFLKNKITVKFQIGLRKGYRWRCTVGYLSIIGRVKCESGRKEYIHVTSVSVGCERHYLLSGIAAQTIKTALKHHEHTSTELALDK